MSKVSLRTCLLFVADIKKSKEFYEKLFLQKPAEDLSDFVSFQFEETFFNLHLADRLSPMSTGGSVGYFCVENLDEWVKRAQGLGAQVWRGPLAIEDGWIIVQIQDPFGNVIGFESKD